MFVVTDLETKTVRAQVDGGEARLPATVRRVLLLPVSGGRIVAAETTMTLENVLATELQRQVRFDVLDLVTERADPDFDYAGELRVLEQLHREELQATGVRP